MTAMINQSPRKGPDFLSSASAVQALPTLENIVFENLDAITKIRAWATWQDVADIFDGMEFRRGKRPVTGDQVRTLYMFHLWVSTLPAECREGSVVVPDYVLDGVLPHPGLLENPFYLGMAKKLLRATLQYLASRRHDDRTIEHLRRLFDERPADLLALLVGGFDEDGKPRSNNSDLIEILELPPHDRAWIVTTAAWFVSSW
jgi:hypothetical protein